MACHLESSWENNRFGQDFNKWGRNRAALKAIEKYLNKKPNDSITDKIICDRMVYRFVNETMRCLDEGILYSCADGDLGAIMGVIKF